MSVHAQKQKYIYITQRGCPNVGSNHKRNEKSKTDDKKCRADVCRARADFVLEGFVCATVSLIKQKETRENKRENVRTHNKV
jgi:hypothetical protein